MERNPYDDFPEIPTRIIYKGIIYDFSDTDIFKFIYHVDGDSTLPGHIKVIPYRIYSCISSGRFFSVDATGGLGFLNKRTVRYRLDKYLADDQAYIDAKISIKPYRPDTSGFLGFLS